MRFTSHGAFHCLVLLAVCSVAEAATQTQRPTRPDEVAPNHRQSAQTTSSTPAGPKAPRVEWESAGNLAARLNLKFSWLESEKKFRLKGAQANYDFEVDSRECDLDGQRVFLGEAVRIVKGHPSFTQIDANKLLAPIMRPGEGARSVPSLKTIILDAGHGGNDAGMINKHLGICEKNLALDTVFRLQKILEKNGYRVVLTRKDDHFIELVDRPALADKVDADLFVSVHFNSVEQGVEKVTGVEVYTMTPQYQLSTDQKPDAQYANIVNPGNLQDAWNVVLGSCVHKSLLHSLEVPDRGLKRGRLVVLRLVSCPAVLVESGFLSNDTEARKLATPQYRQRIAEAIAEGVQNYGNTIKSARRSSK